MRCAPRNAVTATYPQPPTGGGALGPESGSARGSSPADPTLSPTLRATRQDLRTCCLQLSPKGGPGKGQRGLEHTHPTRTPCRHSDASTQRTCAPALTAECVCVCVCVCVFAHVHSQQNVHTHQSARLLRGMRGLYAHARKCCRWRLHTVAHTPTCAPHGQLYTAEDVPTCTHMPDTCTHVHSPCTYTLKWCTCRT